MSYARRFKALDDMSTESWTGDGIWERVRRAAARAQARDERERRRLYQEHREAGAARKTAAITRWIGVLDTVLSTGMATPSPPIESLKLSPALPPYDPGPLAVPIPPPDPRRYEPPAPAGLRALSPSARRQYEQRRHDARVQFEQAWHRAQQAETERLLRLDLDQRGYREWADSETQRIEEHNRAVDDVARRAANADPEAIPEFFAALLRLSAPESLPDAIEVAWDDPQLLVSRELPDIEVIPPVTRFRYVKSDDRELEIKRPVGERRETHRRLLAQCALRVVWEAFRIPLEDADHHPLVRSVVFNGYLLRPDPATGRPGPVYVATLMADRAALEQLDLTRAEPIRCVEGLMGQVSPRPDKAVQVRPIRLPSSLDSTTTPEESAETDLLTMDPTAFEGLVADLFNAMGFQTETTASTGDGGVDIIALDTDPVRGGRMVIQVKRYDSTIPPSVVRDLYGTVLHEGAMKGILVTTAGFGPGSRGFAAGKPLTLIDGPGLLALLAEHGLSGRIDRIR